MATPSEILRKEKSKADSDDKKTNDKDDKKGGTKRNALIDFIAKHKKAEK